MTYWYHWRNYVIFVVSRNLKSDLKCEDPYVEMDEYWSGLRDPTKWNPSEMLFIHNDEQNYFLDTLEEEIKLPICLPRGDRLKIGELPSWN